MLEKTSNSTEAVLPLGGTSTGTALNCKFATLWFFLYFQPKYCQFLQSLVFMPIS